MQLFDTYRIIKALGSQTRRKFANVYLIENRSNHQLFVLKIAQLSKHGSIGIMQLKKEAEFSFDCPGLPKVIEKHLTDDEVALIFEFQKGQTLDAYAKKLKSRQKLTFLKQFTQSIQGIFEHLAQNDIVHCDLKEGNFLVREKNGELLVSLIDFGLAIKKGEIPGRKTLFPLGYAAPELILNELSLVNQSTDIFSLGIIYWKLMAGNLPLVHENPSIFTNLQITHPLPEHSRISKELFSVLNKMCSKHQFKTSPNRMEKEDVIKALSESQQKRYQNISEVIEALQKIPEKKGLFSRVLF